MEKKEKRRFKATIAGKDYVLVGNGTVEHMQAVTDLLNEQLDQLHEAMPASTEEERAILIAFNAISKQFKLEEKHLQQGHSTHKND
ncbi:cell division protein ZapA [Lentilactobacillus sp. IMAU92037]|uniref:cell division protein ZapA n=1 Tax=Lentilactobacillus dabitei TaxID=2831523 RepID=UPI001C267373|nr:cell division protein ZapA [Lentilactobacillus dabitei]MBU9788087.1 cell division protein ZapA [Lentilactobacillus dabitei]MBV0930038.1 cell division protein ZapA [Lentilactobacillus dabitei]